MKIHFDKDPTLRTLAIQEALAARGLYKGALDNWEGPATEDALEAFQALIRADGKAQEEIGEQLADKFRNINARGVELIQHFESSGPIRYGQKNEKYLTAYLDDVGVWTIGYGHTGLTHKDGTVKKGRQISLEMAEELFRYDMDYFEGQVCRLVKVPLNDDQYAALVSFAFNCGEGNLASSTLLRKLNAGDYQGAADQFPRWNKGDGRVLPGLTRRRASERNLFLGKASFIVQS